MKILVINGPNLNMLGIREPNIYGAQTIDALEEALRAHCAGIGAEVDFYQSNHEGGIIDCIQCAYNVYGGIILNPAAYTHTSIAIADAVKAVGIPTVEVHLSDVSAREDYRKISYVSACCVATISGRHFQGYLDAADLLISRAQDA